MSERDEQEEGAHEELDLERRALCPDDACIGVIGPEGRCRECGLPAGADAAHHEANDYAREHQHDDDDPEHGNDHESEEDDAERRLCPDGDCIGVIGPDGSCKVCGAVA